MENSNSPFRFAEYIKKNIPLSPEQLHDFNPFLINKLYYYSGADKICNLMNILWPLPKDIQYRLFCVLFHGYQPHGWIKSTKTKEPNLIEVEYLKKVYQVSTKVAREYVELLTKAEKKEIKKVFE